MVARSRKYHLFTSYIRIPAITTLTAKQHTYELMQENHSLHNIFKIIIQNKTSEGLSYDIKLFNQCVDPNYPDYRLRIVFNIFLLIEPISKCLPQSLCVAQDRDSTFCFRILISTMT